MAIKKIRVLIVDDSMFIREFISNSISKDAGIEVVGTAADPFEARDKIIELSPDVMTLDVQMPKMNGIDFLKKLMPQYPLPVLVVSAASNIVFDALNAGAVDFINKTNLQDENARNSFISELVVKIKIASIAKVGQHKQAALNNNASPEKKKAESLVIAIGASTGGTEAIYNIFKNLGNDLPGIIIVQHMPPVFTKLYADRLNNSCAMEVKEAEDGDILIPGRAIVAAGDYHLELVKKAGIYKIKCFKGERVNGHCPSVDVMFNSVAAAAGSNALGIILTGMGSDGAKGLLAMKNKGANTFGQNKESCVVYGMPAVAYSLGAVEKEMPLTDMPKKIYEWYDYKA